MLVLAHRGARRDAPENTLEAFSVARTQGADGVELDVHRTADDGLVVHHDAEAPGLGLLAGHRLAEIRAACPSVPELAAVLDTCAGMLVNIEIKNAADEADHDPQCRVADLVVELLEARASGDDDPDRVVVSSFDLPTIDRVRALAPGVPTGFLTFGADPLDTVARAADRGHGAAHPDGWTLAAVAGATVASARERAVVVNTWTVNDPGAIGAFAAAGIHGLITDVPAVALRALGR